VLDRLGLWRFPGGDHPAIGIVTWVLVALGILFGMDRGIPREGLWGRRLLWGRRTLLLSAFAALAALVMLR
jgi:hypothetical protein